MLLQTMCNKWSTLQRLRLHFFAVGYQSSRITRLFRESRADGRAFEVARDGRGPCCHGWCINMFALLAAPSFVPPVSRRDAIFLGIGASAIAAPLPAFAELYGEGKAPKVDQKTSIERAKDIKYMKAGTETPEFIAAEKKRLEVQKALESGQKVRQETTEEQMARLGLKPYS